MGNVCLYINGDIPICHLILCEGRGLFFPPLRLQSGQNGGHKKDGRPNLAKLAQMSSTRPVFTLTRRRLITCCCTGGGQNEYTSLPGPFGDNFSAETHLLGRSTGSRCFLFVFVLRSRTSKRQFEWCSRKLGISRIWLMQSLAVEPSHDLVAVGCKLGNAVANNNESMLLALVLCITLTFQWN